MWASVDASVNFISLFGGLTIAGVAITCSVVAIVKAVKELSE